MSIGARRDDIANSTQPASLGYRRAVVRDLAWLVLDGALTMPPGSAVLERVVLDNAERAEFFQLLALWDQDSEDRWLGPIEPRLPLGHYVERLLGAWLRQSRLIRLLATNWTLTVPDNGGKRTVGEADFLVQRQGLAGSGRQLWEVACKIYLGLEGSGWLGPGLNDSLDAKVVRVRDHQLRLIAQAGFKAAWGSDWTARAWLTGWLLVPATDFSVGAELIETDTARTSGTSSASGASAATSSTGSQGRPDPSLAPRIPALWAEIGDHAMEVAENRAMALGVTEWWSLPRRRWLRPVFADEPQGLCSATLAGAIVAAAGDRSVGGDGSASGNGEARPVMLAGIRRLAGNPVPVACESMRLMVVPAGWAHRAQHAD